MLADFQVPGKWKFLRLSEVQAPAAALAACAIFWMICRILPFLKQGCLVEGLWRSLCVYRKDSENVENDNLFSEVEKSNI